ncbi:MAG: hypothetical protein A2710_12660 [Burkholderiales bacterium RIFCSPHIGHO2_01_FULL_64_960]|nr:MAG: hypothetical protein A2710_12660 [Burkholderiales bacterium RIFCSPHIGHO2_01_FULL_64_960]
MSVLSKDKVEAINNAFAEDNNPSFQSISGLSSIKGEEDLPFEMDMTAHGNSADQDLDQAEQ